MPHSMIVTVNTCAHGLHRTFRIPNSFRLFHFSLRSSPDGLYRGFPSVIPAAKQISSKAKMNAAKESKFGLELAVCGSAQRSVPRASKVVGGHVSGFGGDVHSVDPTWTFLCTRSCTTLRATAGICTLFHQYLYFELALLMAHRGFYHRSMLGSFIIFYAPPSSYLCSAHSLRTLSVTFPAYRTYIHFITECITIFPYPFKL